MSNEVRKLRQCHQGSAADRRPILHMPHRKCRIPSSRCCVSSEPTCTVFGSCTRNSCITPTPARNPPDLHANDDAVRAPRSPTDPPLAVGTGRFTIHTPTTTPNGLSEYQPNVPTAPIAAVPTPRPRAAPATRTTFEPPMPAAVGVEPTKCPPMSIGGGQAVVGPSRSTGVGVVSSEPPMLTAAGVEPTKCPPMPESIRATGAGQAVVEPPMPTAIGVEHLSSYPAHLPLPPAQPFVPTPILLPMPQPLYELPPSDDPPITGSRIGRPGWQFDLEYMQRLGMPG